MRSYTPTVNDVQQLDSRGPWPTKSGGELNVMLAIPFGVLQNLFLYYDQKELGRVPSDIRGLRVYTVRKLPKGRIGGTEWHRMREEIVFGLEGSVLWTCEDLSGGKREFVVTPNRGVWMPPYILHTYEVQEEDSGLFVVADTLFIPDDPRTHDTYLMKEFRDLQATHQVI